MKARTNFNWLHCLGFVVALEVAGNIGSLATFSQITTWYAALAKPAFSPPNWIFGQVWTLLFALMGVAFYLIWIQKLERKEMQLAVSVFSLQLALNVLWSFIFFGFHQPGFAFFEIITMWLAIVATIKIFYRYSRLAAWLLVPYLAWVTFASILNYAVWQLN